MLFFLAFTWNSTLSAVITLSFAVAFASHVNNNDLCICCFLLTCALHAASSGSCHWLEAGRDAVMSLRARLVQQHEGEGKWETRGEVSWQQISDSSSTYSS